MTDRSGPQGVSSRSTVEEEAALRHSPQRGRDARPRVGSARRGPRVGPRGFPLRPVPAKARNSPRNGAAHPRAVFHGERCRQDQAVTDAGIGPGQSAATRPRGRVVEPGELSDQQAQAKRRRLRIRPGLQTATSRPVGHAGGASAAAGGVARANPRGLGLGLGLAMMGMSEIHPACSQPNCLGWATPQVQSGRSSLAGRPSSAATTQAKHPHA